MLNRNTFYLMKYLLLICFAYLLANTTYAQTTIQGRVADEKDNPLPGLAVEIDGTSLGSDTDIDGEVTIRNAATGSQQNRGSVKLLLPSKIFPNRSATSLKS